MRHISARWIRVTAWLLAGIAVPILVAALVLVGLNASRTGPTRTAFNCIVGLAVLVYAAVGRVIASRVPRNAVGWLLGLMGLLLAAEVLAEQYALYGLATAPDALPAARLAGWAAGLLERLPVLPLIFVVLLFPDGSLPSRRWRPVSWATFLAVAGAATQQLQVGVVSGGLTDALDAAKVTYPNPLGILPSRGWFSVALAMIFVLSVITVLLVVGSVFVRWRRASVERRKQIAWLGYVGLLTVLWALVLFTISAARNGNSGLPGTLSWIFMVLTALLGIPLASAVAVLKYRLYEIDRIISRTLGYAIVTGLLISVYAGLVLLATQVFRFHAPVAVAGSTLAAAALFTPLRSRVQRRVDRRFNRARYDADRIVDRFAAHLKDAVDLDSVCDDLAAVVHKALEPAHVSLWIRPDEQHRRESVQVPFTGVR